MKMFFRVFVVALLLCAGSVSAQSKFGHIDMQQLIPVMPEFKTAQDELQVYAKGLEEQLQQMQSELQVKAAEFQKGAETMSDAVMQAKRGDLEDLNQRITTFSQTAQQGIGKKESEMINPIIEKANATIATVAKANGFIYVFNVAAVAYKSSESVDVLPLVKKELGIQ